MAHFTIRSGLIVLSAGLGVLGAAGARADAVGYLVNVTMRPGYNFADADAALAYGNGICGKVAAHQGYPQLIGEIEGDFGTTDDYQAGYLIGQAVDQLCPALIWQLRESAAGYRPR